MTIGVYYCGHIDPTDRTNDYIHCHGDEATIYWDRDRTSFKQFDRLLADCKAGTIDLIIAPSISRFVRDPATCLVVMTRLRALGIPVWFSKEQLWSTDSNGLILLMAMADLATLSSPLPPAVFT